MLEAGKPYFLESRHNSPCKPLVSKTPKQPFWMLDYYYYFNAILKSPCSFRYLFGRPVATGILTVLRTSCAQHQWLLFLGQLFGRRDLVNDAEG